MSAAVVNRRWLITGIAAMLLTWATGCHQDVKTGTGTVNLWANTVSEKCIDLAAGETLAYRFNANQSLLFNIHYHQQQEVIYAVAERLAVRSSGTLAPDISARYCLMWTNPDTHVARIEYDYTIR